jgi:hypothetical protein
MDAHQVLVLLNELFCSFDEAVEKHGLYKVETVGDACEYKLFSRLFAVALSVTPMLRRYGGVRAPFYEPARVPRSSDRRFRARSASNSGVISGAAIFDQQCPHPQRQR